MLLAPLDFRLKDGGDLMSAELDEACLICGSPEPCNHMIERLESVLNRANARATFDRGRDNTHPCLEKSKKEHMRQEDEMIVRWVRRLGVAVVAVIALAVSCTNVSTGNVGVVKHFGAVQPYTLSEGINFTRPWPFATVTQVTTQNNATDTEASAASKDLQAVHTKVTIQWSLAPATAPRFLQSFGDCDGCWVGLISPAVQEVVKAVSARYTAEELITRRAQVKAEIEVGLNDFIRQTLTARGVSGAIRIANVAVTNFEFSNEFNTSIEAKVKAEQDSLRAKNEMNTRVTQAEAKAREVTLAAEADAAKTKLAADATAYQTDAESKARAAAITREAAALQANPGLVQLRIAERWNGALPTYTGATLPLLQIK